MNDEVGWGKPPKEHWFRPGHVPVAHRRKGSVGLVRLLREKFAEEVPGKGKTLAEALITKIAVEALRNPIKYWPVLKALMDRDEPVLTAAEAVQAVPPEEDREEVRRRFEAYLESLPDGRRSEVVGLLLEVEAVIRNGSVTMGGRIREEGWGGGPEGAGSGRSALPAARKEGGD